jgi:hypothetical protein
MIKNLAIFTILISLPFMVSAGDFDNEIEVINAMTKFMNEFADIMETASEPAEYIAACENLADGMEEYSSALMEIMVANPLWAYESPAELQEAMFGYMSAAERFAFAMQKILMYANNNMNNEEFQEAFTHLNRTMYDM